MPSTNPYFTATTGYTGEQNLIDNLVIEQIAIYGIDLLYMPRENLNLDTLLHESPESAFSTALSIPMYIKSFDGYDNSMEMLTKFGVRSSDELTLVMSRSQWTAFYGPYVKSIYNADSGRPLEDLNNPLRGEISRRPKEGDVIFFPYDGGLFEVKYVQFDQPFYQLGKGYVFELQCEKFEYSGEQFNTGIDQIDSANARSTFPDTELLLVEGGGPAFDLNERVKLYNLTDLDLDDIATTDGKNLLTETDSFLETDGVNYFQMYNDAGFLREVLVIEGTVVFWNGQDRKLSLSNLTDLNPSQLNPETGDVSIEDFRKVLVLGETSGAHWISYGSQATPKAFDDAVIIQDEFNEIKIFDPADASPFGFY